MNQHDHPAMPMPLATSRYQDYRPEHGVPIRITVGHPRFFKHKYETAMALAPHELFKPPYKGIDDIPTETLVYNRRLNEHAAEILAQLRAVAARHPGQTGVLLCYEKVNQGEACHRRWFATWAETMWGWNIPEIGSPEWTGGGKDGEADQQLLAF